MGKPLNKANNDIKTRAYKTCGLDIGQASFDDINKQLLMSLELPANSGNAYIMRIAVADVADARRIVAALGLPAALLGAV